MTAKNMYEKLVEDLGEDGAKARMAEYRQKVKKPGFSGNSEMARKVAEARWHGKKDSQSGKTAKKI